MRSCLMVTLVCVCVRYAGEMIAMHGLDHSDPFACPALIGQSALFARYIVECSHRLHALRAVTHCQLWRFSADDMHRLVRQDAR